MNPAAPHSSAATTRASSATPHRRTSRRLQRRGRTPSRNVPPLHRAKAHTCGCEKRHFNGFCRRRSDAETAADCAAETFLVAWRRLDDVPDGEAALGWLYGVARRVLANEFRRARRWRRLRTRLRSGEPAPEETPEVVVVRREQDQMMLAALARLRPGDQELLRLVWWEELSHAEIAELKGCSTQAASQRIHRATLRAAREYERLNHSHRVTQPGQQLRGGEAG